MDDQLVSPEGRERLLAGIDPDSAEAHHTWRAKHLDFDTACGFDVQFLFGGGVQSTLAYLEDHGYQEIARELSAYPELHEDLQGWLVFRRGYFCGYFYGHDR